MAASTTDVDRTRWVESETAVKVAEPSFSKKKRDNVNKCYSVFTVILDALLIAGGLFTDTKSSVYFFPLLEYLKTSSSRQMLLLHDSNVRHYMGSLIVTMVIMHTKTQTSLVVICYAVGLKHYPDILI